MKIERGTREYSLAGAALFFGSLSAFGAEHCVQPIIPVFTARFGVDPTVSSLTVSFGTAGMAFSMFLIAIFAQRLPRKKVMAGGLIIASMLAIAMSLSESFTLILGLRFVQGMLLAGFPAMAIAYINEEFDPTIIGRVTGIYIAGTSVGGLAGRLFDRDGVVGIDGAVERSYRQRSGAVDLNHSDVDRRRRFDYRDVDC